MGTSCSLKWREAAETERLWAVEPSHPIADGIGEYIELEETEMYGERFDIPAPDTLVFNSWFAGGEVFRSGCCYRRGNGRVFYFRPGHETYPIYHDDDVRQVLRTRSSGRRRGRPNARLRQRRSDRRHRHRRRPHSPLIDRSQSETACAPISPRRVCPAGRGRARDGPFRPRSRRYGAR